MVKPSIEEPHNHPYAPEAVDVTKDAPFQTCSCLPGDFVVINLLWIWQPHSKLGTWRLSFNLLSRPVLAFRAGYSICFHGFYFNTVGAHIVPTFVLQIAYFST